MKRQHDRRIDHQRFVVSARFTRGAILAAQVSILTLSCRPPEAAVPPIATPITILEYGDFQCPSCGRFARLHWPKLRRTFGDTVQLEFHHWPQPYHPYALTAALAAECARNQQRFEELHDLFFEQQESIGIKPLSSFAKDAGIRDLSRFLSCVQRQETRERVESDFRAAVATKGSGTPTLVIDGTVFRLRADTNWLPRLIDSILTSRDPVRPYRFAANPKQKRRPASG
jgi:protein-disulfide isomerase